MHFKHPSHQLQQAQAKGGHPGMTASVGASGPSQMFDNINQLLILKYWAVFLWIEKCKDLQKSPNSWIQKIPKKPKETSKTIRFPSRINQIGLT